MRELNGRVAVITGASLGIGRAIALELARAGCKVALLARGKEKLDELAARIKAEGGQAAAFPCDLNELERIPAVLAEVERALGPVDILVNNAGVGTFKPMDRMSLNEALAPRNLPLGAALAACHVLVPGMIQRGRGHIVNLTSPAGYFPLPNMIPYCAARHAMNGLSLALHEELRPKGIGVTLVCPSKVDTDYFRANDADLDWFPRVSKLFPMLAPETVGRATLRAIQNNRREVLFPFIVWFFVRFYQTLPRFTYFFLGLLGLMKPARPSAA